MGLKVVCLELLLPLVVASPPCGGEDRPTERIGGKPVYENSAVNSSGPDLRGKIGGKRKSEPTHGRLGKVQPAQAHIYHVLTFYEMLMPWTRP